MYLALETLVQQDIPCCQVAMDVALMCKIAHSISYLTAERQQLLREGGFHWGTFTVYRAEGISRVAIYYQWPIYI